MIDHDNIPLPNIATLLRKKFHQLQFTCPLAAKRVCCYTESICVREEARQEARQERDADQLQIKFIQQDFLECDDR